jgi:glycosyltransferase involved in cell wall biosynthesis
MYPNILVYSKDFYSFFTEHRDEFTFTLRIVSLDEISLLFQCNYALLVTFGDCFIDLPDRLIKRWVQVPSLDVDVINSHVLDAYMKLILAPQRPIFSIFTTCFHSYDKIKRAYQSVLSQTMQEWEWVVLDDSIDDHFGFLKGVLTDPRVRLFKREHHGFIGNVKQEAVSLCRGDYVLELDHDDEIIPSLLSDAVKVFEDTEVGFVYTDYCNLYENGDNFHYGDYFSLGYGGYYRQFYKGKWVFVAMSPNINSATLSHIVSIPNHARMWRRKLLLDIGNYNEYLPICDDYELLLRTAVHTKMVRIPKLGYIQYMNNKANNFSLIRNSEINRLRQHLTPLLYEELHIPDIMEQKGALDTSDLSVPIWKKEYRYCNGIVQLYETQYCILGLAAFHQHYAAIKRLYLPQNDFILLENKHETIGKVLERFKMTRIKFYFMECTNDELLAYFDVYKSGPSFVWSAQRIPPIICGGFPKKLTIITPCTRPGNLIRLKESIPFDYVAEWIIVYDESVTPNAHLFQDERIKEYGCQGYSIAGNIQRNYALDRIGDTYVYFLDDDTIMHPDMVSFLPTLEPNHIYTFDQERNAKDFPFTERLKGDTIEMFRVDTAMFLIDAALIQTIRWAVDEYTADAIFITECYSNHPESWIYVDRVLSYYNYLT